MKFLRTKFDSLDGKTVVALTSEDDKFQLKASRSGVMINGELEIEGMQELDQFAKLLSDAWKEHLRLKPKLQSSLSGH